MSRTASFVFCLIFTCCLSSAAFAQNEYSGIYPHLASFNNEGECGTGAVVPWAGRLWAITYGPHKPKGSSDKLYEITPDLKMTVRAESIGGTPANRMIHRESEQLFIGPYVIDKDANVRVIPYDKMMGRHTANARHLTDPAGKIYYGTMEEGFYEVDVKTLEVATLYDDNHVKKSKKLANLPGAHGKGLYSGQGKLFYANNGEKGKAALRDPFVTAGVLSEWDGKSWKTVRRCQFTDITGPGGIYGNDNPETDPVWAIGWDAKSLVLMLLDSGKWHSYRLPKVSHSYDGAHGWNTEWPRIREIGEKDLLMTMHGMFWRFPKTFSAKNSKGIAPRSSYLKVVGDFCKWQDRIVLGCDDTAKNQFLNKRKVKGRIKHPQAQSNLWFIEPTRIDQLGAVYGNGSVWLNEAVQADAPSEAFMFEGYERRSAHLYADKPATFTFEVDLKGDGNWSTLTEVKVDGAAWLGFTPEQEGVWIRVRSDQSLKKGSVSFAYTNQDRRQEETSDDKFAGLVTKGRDAELSMVGGVMRPYDKNVRKLQYAAKDKDGMIGHYVLDMNMQLTKVGGQKEWSKLESDAAIPSRKGSLEVDASSVIYTTDEGQRFRLPKSEIYTYQGPLGNLRLCREVVTERDLFNCHGTFFELPARNAAGFHRVRPVATHNLAIHDYCTYRGLFLISGVQGSLETDNKHIIKSDDGKAALWVGAYDDLWNLGKPVGVGGPWHETEVKSGKPSDPYLMNGYEKKSLLLKSEKDVNVKVQVDVTGVGDWRDYKSYKVKAGQDLNYEFPINFQAYWVRFVSDQDSQVTAKLTYE